MTETPSDKSKSDAARSSQLPVIVSPYSRETDPHDEVATDNARHHDRVKTPSAVRSPAGIFPRVWAMQALRCGMFVTLLLLIPSPPPRSDARVAESDLADQPTPAMREIAARRGWQIGEWNRSGIWRVQPNDEEDSGSQSASGGFATSPSA
ncbi:MAG: hypothetical protein AAFP69_21970 [Planctomycetota bacterium]